jgi:mediator of RNA polymerase II transcription subunit 31
MLIYFLDCINQFRICNDIFRYISGGPETEDQQKLRFQVELEFVQCLANPNYLNCNAVFLQYLDNVSFINTALYVKC